MPLLVIYQTRASFFWLTRYETENKHLLGTCAVANHVTSCPKEKNPANFQQWSQYAKKRKRKKRKKDRENFLGLGDLVRRSKKVFIESQRLLFCQQKEEMMEWPRDRLCNVIEIKNNEIIQLLLVERSWNQWFLSRKVFCIRRFRKKKMLSEI